MAGLKIKEAELVDELTEDCLFPISDGSGRPRVANFMKVKILLGDAKSVENKVNSLQREVNYLTRNGKDSGISVREIVQQEVSNIEGSGGGTTVDLSNYYTKNQVDIKINNINSTLEEQNTKLVTLSNSINNIDSRVTNIEDTIKVVVVTSN